MPAFNLAFDRTARRTDSDGRLHVERTHISKANICPYYGHEIPAYEALGLSPDRIYRLYRDPVELERGAESFARLPILSKHVPVSVDAPQPDLVIGSIGSDITFVSPYLDADLCFWDATAIAGIETEKVRELSCAYRYVPVMDSGEVDGEKYDGRMTEIRGNHLALVPVGRAGSDVVVADHNPFHKFKESAMKKTKLGTAIFSALCAMSTILAADAALPALVGNADKATFKKDDVKAKLLAMDAKLDPVALDNMIGAMLDQDTPSSTPAADDSAAGKLRALLAGKGVDEETIAAACAMIAAPAMDDTDKDDEEMEAAMDAFRTDLRKEFKESREAARDVRPVVGDVALDSAADIYGFALDHLKVGRAGVEGVAGLRALFKAASVAQKVDKPVVIAHDAGAAVARFPGIARFKQA